MPTTRSPHKGSMEFWPRKRAKRPYARIRHYSKEKRECGLLGFAGYKVGMVQLAVIDNRPTSMTKGEEIIMPATIIECPPMRIASIRIYKNTPDGLRVATDIPVANEKELGRKIRLSKKTFDAKLQEIEKKLNNYDDIRAVVYTRPAMTGIGKKKPEMFEMMLSSDNNSKFAYLKERIGKDIAVDEIIKEGQNVDLHSITKGKGIQGPVKRFGVSIRSHKSEKTKRGPGSLADWCSQGKIMYRVAHAGQMGYHQRTEYNKIVLKVGRENINPKHGFKHYGIMKNPYVIVLGSAAGTTKRLIRINHSIREKKKLPEGALVVKSVLIK